MSEYHVVDGKCGNCGEAGDVFAFFYMLIIACPFCVLPHLEREEKSGPDQNWQFLREVRKEIRSRSTAPAARDTGGMLTCNCGKSSLRVSDEIHDFISVTCGGRPPSCAVCWGLFSTDRGAAVSASL